MKSLRPIFQRSKRFVSAGFLVAGIFLSVPTPAVCSGVPTIPAWYPFEKDAYNLYISGTSQESSDPQGALKTLLQAQQDSRAAIRNGGGANPIVLHNDAVIGRAVATAQMDVARASDNKEATEKQNGNGNNPVKTGSVHVQANGPHTTPQQLAHRTN